MLRPIKNLLGIESIKLNLELPEIVPADAGIITGNIIITSASDQLIKAIEIRLMEKYERGKGEKKLINDYVAGRMIEEKDIKILANKPLTLEFDLPFEISKSEMDKIGEQNFMTKIFVKAAKVLHNVKSEYRVEATAKVKGSAINPMTSKTILVK